MLAREPIGNWLLLRTRETIWWPVAIPFCVRTVGNTLLLRTCIRNLVKSVDHLDSGPRSRPARMCGPGAWAEIMANIQPPSVSTIMCCLIVFIARKSVLHLFYHKRTDTTIHFLQGHRLADLFQKFLEILVVIDLAMLDLSTCVSHSEMA